MKEKQLAVAVAIACTILLSACDPTAGGSSGFGIDTKPIESGMDFLGLSLVLAALVLALARFIRR